MTTDYRPPTPPASGDGPTGATGQAQQAAQTAKDEGRHVAEEARSEAQNVAAEAQQQAKNLLDDARSQIEEQSRSQLESLVGLLRGFGDDLERMARGEGPEAGLARDVVNQVSERARSISSQIQGREPGELLEQVRGFARRKPGTFLLGALAAGVVAGRLTRGAKDAHSDSAGGSTGSAGGTAVPAAPPGPTSAQVSAPPATGELPTSGQGLTAPTHPGGTATADPLAGTDSPTEAPAYPEGTRSSATEWGTP